MKLYCYMVTNLKRPIYYLLNNYKEKCMETIFLKLVYGAFLAIYAREQTDRDLCIVLFIKLMNS